MNARLIFYPLFLLIAGGSAFWVWDTYYSPENQHELRLKQQIKQMHDAKPSEEKEVQKLRIAFLKGDYETLESSLQKAHKEKRLAKTGKSFVQLVYTRLFAGLHSSEKLKQTIDAWIEHYPNSAFAYLTKGLYASYEGWEIRGGDVVSRTYSNRMEGFGVKQKEGIELLAQSIKLDPTIAYAYEKIALMFGYVGGNSTLSYMERIYDEAIAAGVTDTFGISRAMVSHAYRPRWGGDLDEMKNYVYFVNKDAPANSLLPLLILDLHEELSFGMKQSESLAYYQKPEVWSEVSSAIEKVIKAYPAAEWYSTYAKLARKANKNDLVAEMLNKAYYADPYYFQNYADAAEMYLDGKMYDAAEHYLNEYLMLEQTNYEPYSLMAWIQLEKKQYQQAADYASKGVELFQDNCELWMRRCIAYRELKEYDKALSDCNEAVNRRPACGMAYFNRSKVLEAMGRKHEADLDMTMYNRLNK